MLVLRLCCVCVYVWPNLYGDCGCLRGCVHVCECACLYCDRVVFVCVSDHVCIVIVFVFAFVLACL